MDYFYSMELYKSRKRVLPVGWYPEREDQVIDIIREWEKISPGSGSDVEGTAAIVPHAGWFFSGDIAFRTMAVLKKNVDTVVIVGGHLPAGAEPLCYNYMQLETPLGSLRVDTAFLEELSLLQSFQPETGVDNTVEIQLPLIKYLFPESNVVAIRAGADNRAIDLGKDIYQTAQKLNRSIVVIGSTDLTHYGDTYHFTPHGHGEAALSWMKNSNDKKIIEEMVAMNGEKVILLGNTARAACSPGAAVCAFSFAGETGRERGYPLFYKTSYDVYPGDSFVGYVGIYY